ncbi:hemolysin family protein [Pontibacter ruber]|uniref:Hemolysin family protein n=1 Tax=Pontibacter ruber TaxID=1343895 RepID=A0ABW5CWB3_9BACT|nr:hemolysin family protein [Pontibacter ruber]
MEFLVILILALINGFFALSEIALVSVKRTHIEQKAHKGSRNAKVVLQLLRNPAKFLSAVQVGITLIGIIAGAYGGTTLAGSLTPLVASVGALTPYAPQISFALIVFLITYFTIVVGELIPKTIALHNAERIVLLVAPVVHFFTKAAYPLVKLLSGSTNLILHLLHIPQKRDTASLTEEELRYLIKVAGKEGVLEKEEQQIHDNIFYLYEQRNRSLMTYRTEVEWIDLNCSPETIHQLIVKSSHSKFPVCQGNMDNVIGILAVKDYLEHLNRPDEPLTRIIKPPLFVSELMIAMNTLKMFRKKKQYMGIVVNEFGDVEGIITLHDIMEAIVGELPDVGEVSEPEIFRRDDGSYLVSGSILIRFLNQAVGNELIPDLPERYSTLGGFILYTLARIPGIGDKIRIQNYQLEVLDMDGSRIDKVLLKEVEPVSLQEPK